MRFGRGDVEDGSSAKGAVVLNHGLYYPYVLFNYDVLDNSLKHSTPELLWSMSEREGSSTPRAGVTVRVEFWQDAEREPYTKGPGRF